MDSANFELDIVRQHWIKDDGIYDKNDLCSHGEVYIKIGSEELSDKDAGSWSLSTAGLFLMRSLEQDSGFQENANYMVPCCGHSIYPLENETKLVIVPGCNSGVDWKVKHVDDLIELTTERGTKARLRFDQYKNMVLAFADEVESFYGDPKEKNVPSDEYEEEGFTRFWDEWNALKRKWA